MYHFGYLVKTGNKGGIVLIWLQSVFVSYCL